MSRGLIITGGLLGIIAIGLYYGCAYFGHNVNELYRCGDFFSLFIIFTGIGWGCKNRPVRFLIFYNIATFWGLLFLMYLFKLVTDEKMHIHLVFDFILISTVICLLLYFLPKKSR